jgi:hypothetical protein
MAFSQAKVSKRESLASGIRKVRILRRAKRDERQSPFAEADLE